MIYKFLFGPVPSRRLGLSLGVDLVPRKVCSLDCVYCEAGTTTALTLDRKEYIPFEEIRNELESYFENNPDPEYFTFSGSGEPTLNSRIGDVIAYIKDKKPDIPIAVLTNGTLLHDSEVRHDLLGANLLLPSIDAASDAVMQKINRPASGLKTETHIQGLVDFRKEFRGTIWLEIMILPGYNNDLKELTALKEAILRINPDKIQLNTLDRPGVIEGIRAATKSELDQIIRLWNLPNAEIIAKADTRKHLAAYQKDIESVILETISRRPCTLDDLSQFLDLNVSEINKYLDGLEAEQKVTAVWLDRGLFYRKK